MTRKKKISQEIKDSFVYETLAGEWLVTDPTDFDQIIPGGPWNTKKAAGTALQEYVVANSIQFI